MLKWPQAMRMPPYRTARRCPITRSAIQPPGSVLMYTIEVYSPYTAPAAAVSNPSPPLETDAVMNRMRSARMP